MISMSGKKKENIDQSATPKTYSPNGNMVCAESETYNIKLQKEKRRFRFDEDITEEQFATYLTDVLHIELKHPKPESVIGKYEGYYEIEGHGCEWTYIWSQPYLEPVSVEDDEDDAESDDTIMHLPATFEDIQEIDDRFTEAFEKLNSRMDGTIKDYKGDIGSLRTSVEKLWTSVEGLSKFIDESGDDFDDVDTNDCGCCGNSCASMIDDIVAIATRRATKKVVKKVMKKLNKIHKKAYKHFKYSDEIYKVMDPFHHN